MQYRVLHSMLTRDNKIIVHTYVRENGNYYSKFRVRVSIARTRSSLWQNHYSTMVDARTWNKKLSCCW